MLHVYFYEAFAEEAELLRRHMPEGVAAEYTSRTIQESAHVTPPARLICTRTQSEIPPQWAPALGGILSRSTGFDHLAAYAAVASHPLQYGYLPLYCHRAVAEQALLLWLALLRRLPRQIRQFHEFHRDGLTGYECQGRTLAVVGVGNIGREICALGHALGMNVVGVDRDPRHADVQYRPIEEALAAADVVVCAMDLNPSSRGYFDAAKWALVKRGALFVNISRGELAPSTALVAALKAGQLAGAGIDVYDHEAELAVALRGAVGAVCLDAKPPSEGPVAPWSQTPLPTHHHPEALAALELAARDDCICTPHNAFNSYEGVVRKSQHSVQQVVAFLETGQFLWPARV
ncbi:MAG TPA: NAD(P)-dependent oxidoreductase [Lacipirellulaceae bacterium]|nr:NAD(P)-dependent oxidoreductase [Lacipirellulaceae bacterium]